MSTPTKTPFDPGEPPGPPQPARGASDAAQPAGGNETLRPPMPPAPAAPGRTDAEGKFPAPKDDPVLSLYAPRGRAAERPAGPSARDVPERSVTLQPAAPDHEIGEHPAPRLDMTDPDLARLEASLSWVRQQEAVTRLNRSPRPAAAPPRPAAMGYPRGEWRQLQTRPLPEPRIVPPPPEERALPWRWPLLILLTAGVAGSSWYYFSSGSSLPATKPAPSQLAPPSRQLEARQPAAARPVAREEAVAVESGSKQSAGPASSPNAPQRDIAAPAAPRHAAAPSAIPAAPAAPVAPAVRPVPADAAAAAAAAAAGTPPHAGGARPSPPQPPRPERVLSAEEIALLVKQGEQLAAAGDLPAARTLFQRAAENGDVTAAVTLAATYDPNVLARLGAVGFRGDVEKARYWYKKAEDMGSAEAARRLRILAKE